MYEDYAGTVRGGDDGEDNRRLNAKEEMVDKVQATLRPNPVEMVDLGIAFVILGE